MIFATGFDAGELCLLLKRPFLNRVQVTGGLSSLDIIGTDGKTIKESWSEGVRTALGISAPNFPNMFFVYGPHGPTSFANGSTNAEVQSKWLETIFKDVRDKQITRIEATDKLADDWRARVLEVWGISLFPRAKSWYQGISFFLRV